MSKPVCSAATPAPKKFDRDGYRESNHEYSHPDARVTHLTCDEGFLKNNDILIVTRDYPTFVQFYCPHCDDFIGYNRSPFLAKEIPSSFWTPGEYEFHERVYNGELTV